MPTPTTTFRFPERDRTRLDRLATELVCSRTDVLRYGMAALARDPQVRAQIKAENVARIFLKSLRTQYGENAVLELVNGPDDKNWKLAGEPIDEEIVNVDVRRVEDRTVMNLIDPQTGVGISNVMTWTDERDMRHAVVSLDQLWVHAAGGIVSDPATRQLYDGRVVVQIAEDDDSVKYVVLDHEGNSQQLDPRQIPTAAFGRH